MANSVYQINKGINRPVEFKGIKAQYIWYLGGGLLLLLLLFALLYLSGANTYATLIIVVDFGIALFSWVRKWSNKYGEYGMMKKRARQALPEVITSGSRKVPGFTIIKSNKKENV